MSEIRVKPINIPERQVTTSNQVNTLLGVASHFWAMLNAPQNPLEEMPKAGTVQGEARVAAEATFVKACDALQLILDEKPRWDFEFQLSLEKDYLEAMALNRDFLVAQKHSAQELASPHYRRSPVLHKLTDGSWMAILGDLMDMENAIIGVGKCPQEALEAFDKMFSGIVPDSVAEFIEKHTYDTNEQNQQLDGTGNQTPEGTEGRGQEPEGNSSEPGPLA